MRCAAVFCLILPLTFAAGGAAPPPRPAILEGRGCQAPRRLRIITSGDAEVVRGRSAEASFRFEAPRPAGRRPPGPAWQADLRQQDGICIFTLRRLGSAPSTGSLRFTAPASARAYSIETAAGQLIARGLEGDIRLSAGAGAMDLDDLKGNVVAQTGGGPITAGKIDGALRCLSGGGNIRVAQVTREAVLESAGGEVYVENAGPLLRVSTSGNIQVARAAGDVFAYSGAGLVDIRYAAGAVTARSASGGIQVGSAGAALCESGAGGIRLRNIRGRVHASTLTGPVDVSLSSDARLEDSILSSSAGDITVSLPSNLAVTVKALSQSSSWNARVLSEFPDIRLQSRPGAGLTAAAEGALNGGGPLLVLTTSRGSIYLKRTR